MPADLDIVGEAAVDVVPVAPTFHTKLKGIVLPSADRVGEEAGRRIGEAMSRHIVAAIPDAITNGGRTARVAATRQGDDNAGSFARSFKRRLEVAFRSLPRPDVRLSTTGFDADLARVRARMEALANKRVGVDIDAATAVAELNAIDAKLAELGSRSPDIQVRADIATARAELAEMQRTINDIDRDDVNIKVRANTAQAQAALFQLGVSLAAVAALPVVPIAAAGIGAIASAAVAAGAGVGVFAAAAIPAIKGVTSVMQLQSAAADEAARSTGNSAAANVKAAQGALQMAGAQQALRSAHRQSAQAIADANRQVATAERSLSDAKRSARDAEDALTQARRDARQELRSLQDQLLDGVLDEREATLRVTEAREELARVTADPTATDVQRQRAQLSVDEALRNADKQKAKNRELKQTVDEATKAGVDGNKGVREAAQRVADAQRAIQDRTTAVADAQRKVRDAQVQGAEAVASAERGLQSARLSSVDTTAHAVTKTDEYRKALAKLTPEQRDLYDAIAGPKGLKSAFQDWAIALAPDVLPIFTRFVSGAKTALPGLSPLVRETADGISELQDAAGKELKSPFWRGFKKDIEGSAKPAVVGLGKSFGNVFKGMAGVVDAFLPHMDSIADRLIQKTGRFAKWGAGLKGSPAFEKFLQYVAEHGPIVGKTFGDLASAVFGVAKALEPFSTVILELVGDVAQAINFVTDRAPWAIQVIYGLWIATRLWNLAMASNPIGLVVLALVSLALAVKYAWDHFEGFRNAMAGFWTGLKAVGDAAVWFWQSAIVPAFNGIVFAAKLLFAIVLTVLIVPLVLAFRLVAAIAVWLWTDGIRPTFVAIGQMAVWLWTYVLQPIFAFIWSGLKLLGAGFVWLYDHAVKPSFGWIADKSNWLWLKILQPFCRFIWDGIKWLGDKFVWLYDHAIKPSFDWIAGKTNWLNDKVMNPAFSKLKSGVALVASAFESAKDGIAKAWGGLVDITKKPVNFVIEWVYTKGIKAVWDKVAGFVGLDKLPAAPKLLAEGGRTSGGIPGVDSIPALMMADEFVVKRSSARKIGFGTLEYINRTGELPVQRFADGGIVGALGGAWDWTKDKVGGAVSKGIDWAKTGADLVSNPSKIWDRLMKPIVKNFTETLGVADMGKALTKLPLKMIGGLKDKIVDAVTSSGGGGGGNAHIGGGIPSGQRLAIINAAMAAAGVPPPGTVDQWQRGMNTLITRESGWNPNARNNWDINAKNGVPSQGLAQTIPPTFYAHVPASLRSRGILDPVANVAASVRYIVSRYGNITNVQQANANRPPAGYAAGGRVEPMWFDDGGLLPEGLSLIANGTGGPEPVFTGSQFADIRAAKSGGGPTTIQADVRVFVGDREITDIVRTEITTYDNDAATALTNGRIV